MADTFDPLTGAYRGRVPGTVAEIHRRVPPPVIAGGAYAGRPATIDDVPHPARLDPEREKAVAPRPDGTWALAEVTQDERDARAADEARRSERTAVAKALAQLDTLAGSTGTLTAAQLSSAVRLLARGLRTLAKDALRDEIEAEKSGSPE